MGAFRISFYFAKYRCARHLHVLRFYQRGDVKIIYGNSAISSRYAFFGKTETTGLRARLLSTLYLFFDSLETALKQESDKAKMVNGDFDAKRKLGIDNNQKTVHLETAQKRKLNLILPFGEMIIFLS